MDNAAQASASIINCILVSYATGGGKSRIAVGEFAQTHTINFKPFRNIFSGTAFFIGRICAAKPPSIIEKM